MSVLVYMFGSECDPCSQTSPLYEKTLLRVHGEGLLLCHLLYTPWGTAVLPQTIPCSHDSVSPCPMGTPTKLTGLGFLFLCVVVGEGEEGSDIDNKFTARPTAQLSPLMGSR